MERSIPLSCLLWLPGNFRGMSRFQEVTSVWQKERNVWRRLLSYQLPLKWLVKWQMSPEVPVRKLYWRKAYKKERTETGTTKNYINNRLELLTLERMHTTVDTSTPLNTAWHSRHVPTIWINQETEKLSFQSHFEDSHCVIDFKLEARLNTAATYCNRRYKFFLWCQAQGGSLRCCTAVFQVESSRNFGIWQIVCIQLLQNLEKTTNRNICWGTSGQISW